MATADNHDAVNESERFEFGENWRLFLKSVDAKVIDQAKRSLCETLEFEDLNGKRFLDAGSGSGLFSLAAHQLGASVFSFDLDIQSVRCTGEMKQRFVADNDGWVIQQGSVLDQAFLERLGLFDVAYSWGVLHHTGEMWRALENVMQRVAPGGRLFVAIYNDQGRASRRWTAVKRWYNRLPTFLRWMILWPAFVRLWGPTTVRDFLRARPFQTWRDYSKTSRGMSPWRDVVDWVGGYPFEVARPEAVIDFCRQRDFRLVRQKICGQGRGCNEFVFERSGS